MKKPKRFSSSFLIWTALCLLAFGISQITYTPENTEKSEDIPYSEFVKKVESGDVYAVKMQGQQILGT